MVSCHESPLMRKRLVDTVCARRGNGLLKVDHCFLLLQAAKLYPQKRNPDESASLVSFASPLQTCEPPLPQPSGSEVLLRVVSGGIRHTDLNLLMGTTSLGHGEKLRAADRWCWNCRLRSRPRDCRHSLSRAIRTEHHLVHPWTGLRQLPPM